MCRKGPGHGSAGFTGIRSPLFLQGIKCLACRCLLRQLDALTASLAKDRVTGQHLVGEDRFVVRAGTTRLAVTRGGLVFFLEMLM